MHPDDRALIKDYLILLSWCVLAWFGALTLISSTYPQTARFAFFTGVAYAEEAEEQTMISELVEHAYPCSLSRATIPVRCA